MADESTAIVSSVPASSHCKPHGPYATLAIAARALRLSLAIMLSLGGVGCAGGDVWIYVDNTGKAPIAVSVDGKEQATIAPGRFETIKCEPGKRRIRVLCGKDILFSEVKDLQKSDQVGVSRRYFFSPGNRNRYLTYTVKYGSSPFEGLFKPGKDRRSQLRYAYLKFSQETKLMPARAWFEVPVGALVLTKPPDVVMTKNYTERRTVLTRVDSRDYAFLATGLQNKNPSEDNLRALATVVDRVAASQR